MTTDATPLSSLASVRKSMVNGALPVDGLANTLGLRASATGVTVSSMITLPDGTPDARWDDDSVGFVLPRIGDSAIPVGRLLFRAPGSTDLLPGAVRMDIYIPDYAVVVSVWSHLGLDSLSELVDGLRLADPGA